MTQPAGVEQLTDLGLTRYEAQAYLALVGRDRYTAAEVSRVSAVPRQRIYDVLGSLTRRGMVHELPGQVIRYSALDPATAVNQLMAAHRAEVERLERATTQFVNELTPVWASGRGESDPLDFIDVIHDADVLARRFAELQAGCHRQLLTMAKWPFQVAENPVGLRVTRRLIRAGGDVRCIYERGMLDDPHFISVVQQFVTVGEQARIAEMVPMRLCIADGLRVLMSLRDPVATQTSTTNVLIEHPALAQCLTFAFDTIWHGAVDFDQAVADAAQVVRPRSR